MEQPNSQPASTPRPAAPRGTGSFTPRPAGQGGFRPGAGGAPRRPGGFSSGGPSDRKPGEGGGRGDRRGGKPGGRERSEFDQKIIAMRRVTRVVAGGRRFSFSVSLVAGDKKGRVGVGIGKSGDTALAIDKALRDAKKNMVRIPLTKTGSIPHEVEAKFSSAVVRITPAKGRGMVAGSSVRSVLELAGVKDVVAKLHSGSKNHLNQAKGTIKALGMIRSKK
jgi:small subunit ribosomal protein S5